MIFRYVGDHEAVEILGRIVERGGEVEFTGDVAKELEARDDWERTDNKKVEGSK